MHIVKNLVISIVIGLLAYEISKFFLDAGLQLPDTMPEISLLLIFIATAFVSTFIPGRQSSAAISEGREMGTVKWFNTRKGYGFITRDQGDDIFVHFRNIEGSGRRAISEGERVSFVVTTGDKGLQADEVSPA